jgi:hypothetical protein
MNNKIESTRPECAAVNALIDAIEADKNKRQSEIDAVWAAYAPTLRRANVDRILVYPRKYLTQVLALRRRGFIGGGALIGVACGALIYGIACHAQHVTGSCWATDLTMLITALATSIFGGMMISDALKTSKTLIENNPRKVSVGTNYFDPAELEDVEEALRLRMIELEEHYKRQLESGKS